MGATPTSMSAPRKPKILLICTGVGIMNRGFESYFSEAFRAMYGAEGLDVHLVKGGGKPLPGTTTVACIPRTGKLARLLQRLTGRPANAIEHVSALAGVLRVIRRERPDVVFFADDPMWRRVKRFRSLLGVPFVGVMHNSGPMTPPFRGVHVHQVTPFYVEQALAAGMAPETQTLIPMGVDVPEGPPDADAARRAEVRRKLGLPTDRKVVLSVGRIAAEHKRMHHMVREVAAMAEPRPFLAMLGAMDEASPEVIALAEKLLGKENFVARSVPFAEVASYYRAADAFALCSLLEGFGLVYAESAAAGLPTVAHDHPVMRYVLGDAGTFVDMDRPGDLARELEKILAAPLDAASMAARRESVRRRLGWRELVPAYREMFEKVLRDPARTVAPETDPQPKPPEAAAA